MNSSDHNQISRRTFVQRTAATSLAGLAVHSSSQAAPLRNLNDRIKIASIGLRYQGSVITRQASPFGDIVALCDVDRHVREQAKASFGSTATLYEDYRDLLAQADIDVVLIATPDHWHAKMLVDTCRAGKHVYCEKPLTLTIDEGKRIRQAVAETNAIVQVGSWQRSDHRFRRAVEMVRQGRIGKLETVEVVLGKNVQGGPFKTQPVPKHFNWDLWQGQTPDVAYIPERSHYTFRWWYEYSGGQVTDWGAHHIDIAQWAIDSLPLRIESTATFPKVQNGYNVATDFQATYVYQNGVRMTVSDTGRNGILFQGTDGRIFVNRGTLAGTAVDQLIDNPLSREAFQAYDFDNLERPERAGKLDAITNHMGNFFDCMAANKTPISNVESQHRSVSTCHLGNISMQLGRTLEWDATTEKFVNDPQANGLLSREQRKGFEL